MVYKKQLHVIISDFPILETRQFRKKKSNAVN